MHFLPSFNQMVNFYPTDEDPEKVKQQIGGGINQPDITNTCVIRVSRALNYAGHKIPPSTAHFYTRQGADKKWYGLRVKEFWKYMTHTFGKPDVHEFPISGVAISTKNFIGKRGIIGFRVDKWSDASGHFTLWDGHRLLYGAEHYNYWFGSTEAALWQELTLRKL